MTDDVYNILNLSSGHKRALLAQYFRQESQSLRIVPLSYAQRRLWILNQLQPNLSAYNEPIAVRLKGNLQISALESSLNEIIRRQEALRTTFQVLNGEAVQVITPFQFNRVPIIDLSNLPLEEREAKVLRLANEEISQPFDLASGPLFGLHY